MNQEQKHVTPQLAAELVKSLFCGVPNREKRVAVFTAFSDESGAQDPAGSFLVGGYVASVDTWPWLANAWQDRVLNSAPPIPYLHMIEIRRERWQRQYGLTTLQAEAKVSTAVNVIATTGGMSAVHSEIKCADLADALQARGIKREIGIDEPDYQCFIGYAYHVLREVRQRYPEAERVDFVVSRKGKITDHIKEFHEELTELVGHHDPQLGDLVGRLIPDDMEASPPLQAADVFCWHTRRLYETGVQDTNLSWLYDGHPKVVPHRWTKDAVEELADGLARTIVGKKN